MPARVPRWVPHRPRTVRSQTPSEPRHHAGSAVRTRLANPCPLRRHNGGCSQPRRAGIAAVAGDGPSTQLGPRTDAELPVDPRQVSFDSFGARRKACRNCGVGVSVRGELSDSRSLGVSSCSRPWLRPSLSRSRWAKSAQPMAPSRVKIAEASRRLFRASPAPTSPLDLARHQERPGPLVVRTRCVERGQRHLHRRRLVEVLTVQPEGGPAPGADADRPPRAGSRAPSFEHVDERGRPVELSGRGRST